MELSRLFCWSGSSSPKRKRESKQAVICFWGSRASKCVMSTSIGLSKLFPQKGPPPPSTGPWSLWSHCPMHAFQAEASPQGLYGALICPNMCEHHVTPRQGHPASGTCDFSCAGLAHSPAVPPAVFHTETPSTVLALPR